MVALFSKITGKLPNPARLKHFAENLSEAFKATANRKHIPHTNTVINPTSHYESGGHHHVGGQAWDVIAGPRAKNGKPGFLMAEPKGHQVDMFHTTGVGHRKGPANALVPYVQKLTALTIRSMSSSSSKFPPIE